MNGTQIHIQKKIKRQYKQEKLDGRRWTNIVNWYTFLVKNNNNAHVGKFMLIFDCCQCLFVYWLTSYLMFYTSDIIIIIK